MSAADPRLEDAARRVAAEPAPIDQISVYLTASEVFGEPFAQTSMQIIAENSTGRSVSAVCGHLLHLAHDNVRAVEQVLVKEVFHGDILTRVENLLRDEGRFLIAPQLMLLASAMAILYLPWDPGDPANAAALDANGFKTATLLALHAGDLATSDSTERERNRCLATCQHHWRSRSLPTSCSIQQHHYLETLLGTNEYGMASQGKQSTILALLTSRRHSRKQSAYPLTYLRLSALACMPLANRTAHVYP